MIDKITFGGNEIYCLTHYIRRRTFLGEGGSIMIELLTSEEAAKVFRVSLHTIRGWTGQGKIPFIRLGHRILFRREDVERLASPKSPNGDQTKQEA